MELVATPTKSGYVYLSSSNFLSYRPFLGLQEVHRVG